jgi:hypothetical protein
MSAADRWICVLVSYRYLITRGFDQLDGLFHHLMGDDYLEHYPLDPSNEEADDTTSCYVLLHCKNYKDHLEKFAVCAYLRGVLNSYRDVHELSEDEIGAVRKVPSNVIQDGAHTVNRTGFFMPGDIIHITKGPLSRTQGIVLNTDKSGKYRVFFRFFMRSFVNKISVDSAEFISSIFKFYKFPVTRKGLKNSRKLADKIVIMYRKLLQEQLGQQLVEKETQ